MAGALRKTTIEIDWKINNRSLHEANKETDSLVARAGKAEQGFSKTNRSIDGTTSSLKNHNSTMKQASDNVVQFQSKAQSAFNGTARAAQATGSNVVHMNSAIGKSQQSVTNMGKSSQQALNNTKNNVVDLRSKFGELGNGINSMADKASSGIEKGISKPLGAVKGVLLGIGASAGLAGLGGMVNAGIGRLSAIEDAKLSLDVMMGDSGKAQKFMDQVLAFAKTTPYAFQDLATNSKNLLAYGMDPSKVVPTMKAIGDLAAASGKGSEGINTLSNSFGKMQVMGKVSMEQLNTVTEAGVPALKILANANNKSVKDMQKAISDGKVESTKAIAQMVEGIQKGSKGIAGETVALGGVMEKLKGTWKGSLDSMKSAITSTMATLFTPVKPYLQEGMKWFATQFKKLPDMATEAGKMFGPAVEPIKESLNSTKVFITDTVIPTVKDLGAALGPGLVAGGVVSLKAFGWTLEHVVTPPLKAVQGFIEQHPTGMKNTAKFAGVGLAALMGFKVVSSIFSRTKSSVDRLIESIKRIGPTTMSAAAQSNVAMGSMNATANTTRLADNILPAGASRTAPKIAKTPLWRKLTIGTSGAQLAAVEGTRAGNNMSLFSKAKIGMKSTGALGKLAGGAGVIGVGMNALDLLSMNKQNAGEKVGKFGGSTGLGMAGAAIGTAIAPGIGTAIGGMIGAFAGSKFGAEFGKYVQKNWGNIKSGLKSAMESVSQFGKEHQVLGAPIRYVEKHVEEYKKGIKQVKKLWESGKEMYKEATAALISDKTNVGGKGVNKDTAKQVNTFVDADNKMASEYQYKMYSGQATSAKEHTATNKSYDNQANKIVAAYDKKETKSAKNIDSLQAAGVMSDSAAKSAKNRTKEFYNIGKNDAKKNAAELKRINDKMYKEQESATQTYEKRINSIRAKAKKEGRLLTAKESAEITRLEKSGNEHRKSIYKRYEGQISSIQKKQQREAVTAMSKSAKEQKLILGKLQDDSGKISAKQAADIVKNSKKARDGSIKEANTKYNGVIKKAEEEYYVHGSISKQEYEEIVKNAKAQRDGSIKQANDMHDGVVDSAKKQAGAHAAQVNWEKGQVLSVWDNIVIGLSKAVNTVTGGINSVLKFFKIPEIPKWNPSGTSSGGNGASASGTSSRIAGGGKQSGSLEMKYTGSNSASGQIMAGEEGIEIAYNKASAQARILGANGPEITYVGPGTKILNHADSKKVLSGGLGAGKILPGFAKGNSTIGDFVSASVEKVQAAGGAIRDGASAMWDWMSDPVGKAKALITKNNPFGGDGVQALGGGIFKHFGTGVMDYVKNKIGEYMNAGLGPSSGGTFGPRFGSPFRFTSGYGPRVVFGKAEFHKGVDYGAPTGTPLPAQYSGIVSHAGSGGGFGNLVKIKVAQGVETLYGHLSKILTSNGAVVRAGQIIGLVGSTGRSTGPHVHYQVNAGGSPVNPGSSIGGKKEPSSASSGDTAKIAEKKGLAFKNGGRPPVNKSVLVGEEGPELFETDSPGTIHTASQTRDLLSNRKGNGEAHYHFDPTINITVQGSNADAKGIASEVKGALYEMFQQWIEQYQTGEVY
ncbi:peptidoglycan DD-metalloendopeptidase family protein [Listeria booriae]|uniref:peptidoglycan DD-metalloendopeptidase family protein n=1 Tax=Listeria booriae TaxID=1552123 RepID=UPI001629401D|nr:peptidoglycan DD-metalloendopeptidase family protein [Listeria booriae]MBC2077685.1 peptidoglycan DD-metalloendopeptidase family protein [Listeria booriae]